MSRLRRAVAFALSVVAALFFALTAAGGLHEQTFGLTTIPASGVCALLVTRVSNPGQPGGLHAGDMVDTRDLSTHERLRLMVPRQSDHMMLPIHRVHEPGGPAMVMVVPHAQAPSDAAYLRLVVLLVLMLLGLYVMWRGKDAASLGLGIFFTMMPAFLGLSHAYPGLPDQAIIAVLFLATMLNLLGYFGLYFMVTRSPEPHCRRRSELSLGPSWSRLSSWRALSCFLPSTVASSPDARHPSECRLCWHVMRP